MIIITRHKNADCGIRLELDHNGMVKQKSPAARPIGTTVILSNLFHTLPVRKREFHKNIKREFLKMCQILQAYCLVSTGTRIICTNQNKKGVKTTIMSTNSSPNSVLDNITAVFGAKQSTNLVKLKDPINDGEQLSESILEELNVSTDITVKELEKIDFNRFKIDGWISSCRHGSGRTAKDRQFFYINSRPCEPKNIAKLTNEMYRQYNIHQVPFVYLNISIDRCDIDVNITPDKRTILVNDEKILLLALKRSLLNTFGTIPSTFKLQNLDSFVMSQKPVKTLDLSASDSKCDSDDDIDTTKIERIRPDSNKFANMMTQWRITGRTDEPAVNAVSVRNKRKQTEEIDARNLKMKKIQEYLTANGKKESRENESKKECSYLSADDDDSNDIVENNKISNVEISSKDEDTIEQITVCKTIDTSTSSSPSNKLKIISISPSIAEKSPARQKNNATEHEIITTNGDITLSKEIKIIPKLKTDSNTNEIIIDLDSIPTTSYPSTTNISQNISTTIAEIQQALQQSESEKKSQKKINNLNRLKFKTGIDSKNTVVEQELETELSGSDFSRMKIIGQFNGGFIIVQLDDDLFIVDQHAADEKYNFETLQRTTELQTQKLVISQQLELTPVHEMVLLDNQKMFELNGFKFQINDEAEAGRKIKLLAKPFSKTWEFGAGDIDELIFMLQVSI